jgi:hypothetical protein
MGLSAVNTPMPLPPLQKYRKNFSFPSIVLCAAQGAQELPAHLAMPFGPATLICP